MADFMIDQTAERVIKMKQKGQECYKTGQLLPDKKISHLMKKRIHCQFYVRKAV
jgi:hypothetical protein